MLLWSYNCPSGSGSGSSGGDRTLAFAPAAAVSESKVIKGHSDAICGLHFHDAGGMLLTSRSVVFS